MRWWEYIFRTDLALESAECLDDSVFIGFNTVVEKVAGVKITRICLDDDSFCKSFGKPKGMYVTMELGPLNRLFGNLDKKIKVIAKELEGFIPAEGLVLAVGLGNSSVTPDAFGPEVASGLIATRHILGEGCVNVGLKGLRPVAVLAPGVLGQTGIEVVEIVCSICRNIKPSVVIVVDALAAKELQRLGSTIQISDAGILPGSGVGNSRPAITRESLGVPVVSIGVPMVVDALTLIESAFDGIKSDVHFNKRFENMAKSMFVTPREVDTLIEKSSKIVSMAVNKALQPNYSLGDIRILSE